MVKGLTHRARMRPHAHQGVPKLFAVDDSRPFAILREVALATSWWLLQSPAGSLTGIQQPCGFLV